MRSRGAVLALLPLLAGCVGVQSALDPSGAEAARVHGLALFLFGFCIAVFLGVVLAAGIALFGGVRWRARLAGDRLIVWAGLVFPAVSLAVLLGLGLTVMGQGGGQGGRASAAAPGQLRIAVSGERWWWRVTYLLPDGRAVESANGIRLPVGRPVPLDLTSADVIHSLWVPRLAGKLDMIPGRTNTLTLEAQEPGLSRGQCAEYCGGPHALMSFFVVAMPPDQFEAWLEREAADAAPPAQEPAIHGQALFQRAGCGGCHAVRGTPAAGTIGPDLTHVGGRHSLAAASLPNTPEAMRRWIAASDHVKPENLMPPYAIFTEAELDGLAAYLGRLK